MNDGNAMTGAHDCGGDAAAYVLGALEPTEANAFLRHLEDCAVCRDELEALQGVVHALPMAAPQQAAPRRLRRRLMRAIREESQLASGGKPSRRDPSFTWRPRPGFAALATAVVVAGGVLAGVELSAGGGTGRLIQARVTGVSGSAELLVAGGTGELIVRHLTPPPPGHVYEVWVKRPHSPPVPASVLFSVGSSGGAQVGLPQSLRGISQVMVTPEPDGGSPAPTHAPVIIAQLS